MNTSNIWKALSSGLLPADHWKYEEDYVVREYNNQFGEKVKQTGNVWVEYYRNSVGGISTRETFVSTSDCTKA